jgi:hypothetical protein
VQAVVDRLAHRRVDLRRRQIAETTLAGHPDPRRQPAAERFADDQLRLAVAVARRQIDQSDAGSDCVVHRRHAFAERRLTPQHAEPAPAEREGRDRRQGAEAMLLHDISPAADRGGRPL